jgi:hypothetical protein
MPILQDRSTGRLVFGIGITAVGAEASPERQRRRVEVPKPGEQQKQ